MPSSWARTIWSGTAAVPMRTAACTSHWNSWQAPSELVPLPEGSDSRDACRAGMRRLGSTPCARFCVDCAGTRGQYANHLLLHLSLIHISEPTRLGMISYAVFCLKIKTTYKRRHT